MAASSPQTKTHKLGKDFIPRLFTAVVAAPIIVGFLFYGGMALYILFTVVLAIALHEWQRMTSQNAQNDSFVSLKKIILANFLVFFCSSFLFFETNSSDLHLKIDVLFCIFVYGFILLLNYMGARRLQIKWPFLFAMGLHYLLASLLGLKVLMTENQSNNLILFIVFIVWGVDIGAYFFGRLIGGAKLSPRWSPNKTWAGLFGGMASAALVALILAIVMNFNNAFYATLIASLFAVIAQVGDISESMIKRKCGVKDSGAILPGHGGVLDRIDGLLLAMPLFALFQVTLGRSLAWI